MHEVHTGKFGRRFNLFCLKPFRSEPKFACRQNIYGRCQEKYQTAHNSFLARVGRLCNSDLQSTFQHFLKQFVVAVDSDHQTCRTAPPWCPGNRVCVVYAAHTYLRNSGHGSLAPDLVTEPTRSLSLVHMNGVWRLRIDGWCIWTAPIISE